MRAAAPLILLLAVASSGCGSKVAADPNARAAAEWVVSRGGTVTFVGADGPLKKGVVMPEGNLAIRAIDLNQKGITDADLQKLSGLTNLESLGLHSSKLTLQGLDQVVALASLKELELSYTPLTDDGLQKLASLPKLQKLFIYGTRVTKDGVEKFQRERPKVAILR